MRSIQNCILAGFALTLCCCGSLLLPPLEVSGFSYTDTEIRIDFSSELSPMSIREAFSMTENGSSVKGRFAFAGNSVRFIPEYGIRPGKNYSLTVTTAAEDVNGNSLTKEFRKTFTTHTESVRPEIVSISPETETDIDAELRAVDIQFSEPVDRVALQNALSVSPSFEYVIVFSNNDTIASLVPLKPLVWGKRYTIKISTALTDTDSNSLGEQFSSTFLYGTDKTIPGYTVRWKNDSQEAVLDPETENVLIPSDSQFLIEFDEPVSIDSISNYISVTPAISMSIVPDKIQKTSALITLNAVPEWGMTYELKVKKGIQDACGNAADTDTVYRIRFNNEDFRPVTFLKGYFKNGNGGTIADYFVMNGDTLYSDLLLSALQFPQDTDIETKVYLVFSVSKTAAKISLFSAMDSIRLSATNSCVQMTIKKLELAIPADLPFSDSDLTPPPDAGAVSVAVLTVEVRNTIKRGFVSVLAEKSLSDRLGNTMASEMEYVCNKK